MSVEVLDSLKQQIRGLSEAERHSLAAWLVESSSHAHDNTRTTVRELRREWMNTNRRKYGGLYVALEGDQLLGTGKTYPEAYEAARKAGKPGAFVDFVAPEEYVGEIGGWD